MDIFESLENLNVSEECFDEIMDIVEEILSEGYVVKTKNTLEPGDAVVTTPKYAWKSSNIEKLNTATKAKAQELADAANREKRAVSTIEDRRGYHDGVLAPSMKTSRESVISAADRKYGTSSSGKRKATRAIKSVYPDFNRTKERK